LKAVEDMQKRYETTTLKPAEEKKMLADMKKMKESVPNAQRILELKPKIDDLYTKRNDLNDLLSKLKPQLDAKFAEIEKINKEQDEAKEHREDIKVQLDKFEDDITKIKEDVTLLVDKKQQVKEDYYKDRYEHEVEAESIKYSEWIVRIKAQKAEYEKKKIEQLNARKQALADRPNPYQKEIDTADRLI